MQIPPQNELYYGIGEKSEFCLLYKHTNNDVFDDFPKISDHFPNISEDFPKLLQRLDKGFRKFSDDC